MNSRERILLMTLGGVLLLVMLGGGYWLLLRPWLDLRASLSQTETEVRKLSGENGNLRQRLERVDVLNQRSLPGDIDLARREYETALARVLESVKGRTGYTLSANKDSTGDPPPMIEKDKPAYRKISFSITMTKIDVPTLVSFLERYYELNLLHHISSINIKRNESFTGSTTKKDAVGSRRDLDVRLTTEAIILDGSTKRTLIVVPLAKAAALGGAGYFALQQSPVAARGLRPQELERVLAYDREYAMLEYKDLFHGPVPIPEPPKKIEKKEEPPPPPKPGVDAFIKFTTVIRQSDGGTLACVRDQANNIDYDVSLAWKDGKWSTQVLKIEYYTNGTIKDKNKLTGGKLTISDKTSSTNRNFTVYGLDGNKLVLGEAAMPAKETKPVGRPAKGPKLPATPPVNPYPAIIGGVFTAVPPTESIYLWEIGQPLNKLEMLKGKAGPAAIERVKAPQLLISDGG